MQNIHKTYQNKLILREFAQYIRHLMISKFYVLMILSKSPTSRYICGEHIKLQTTNKHTRFMLVILNGHQTSPQRLCSHWIGMVSIEIFTLFWFFTSASFSCFFFIWKWLYDSSSNGIFLRISYLFLSRECSIRWASKHRNRDRLETLGDWLRA